MKVINSQGNKELIQSPISINRAYDDSQFFTPMEQISLRNAILRRRAKIGIIQVEDVQAPVINLRSPEAVMRFFLQKTDSEDIKRK